MARYGVGGEGCDKLLDVREEEVVLLEGDGEGVGLPGEEVDERGHLGAVLRYNWRVIGVEIDLKGFGYDLTSELEPKSVEFNQTTGVILTGEMFRLLFNNY